SCVLIDQGKLKSKYTDLELREDRKSSRLKWFILNEQVAQRSHACAGDQFPSCSSCFQLFALTQLALFQVSMSELLVEDGL
uniref:Uncharacterized protein n=1 Tax=Cucumis melo TaxID=3656 RepID=A0A9I9EEU7_CUCME